MKILWLIVVGLVVFLADVQSSQGQSQQTQSNQVPAQATAPAAVETNTPAARIVPQVAPVATEPQPGPEPADQGLQALITKQLPQTLSLVDEAKPNEIIGKRFKFSGVLVQAAKTDNLLQLFNPLAPVEYGDADDNLLHDPISSAPAGIKLFAIQF